MIESLIKLGQLTLILLVIATVLGAIIYINESCVYIKEYVRTFIIATVLIVIWIGSIILLNKFIQNKQEEADIIGNNIIALSLEDEVLIDEIIPHKKYINIKNISKSGKIKITLKSSGVTIDHVGGLLITEPAIAINIFETNELDFQTSKKKFLQNDTLYNVACLSISDNLTLNQLIEYYDYITFKDDISAELPIQLTFYEQNDCIFAVASNR